MMETYTGTWVFGFNDETDLTTNFLKDIQDPDNAQYGKPNGQWNVNFGYQKFNDETYIKHDTDIIKILHHLASLQHTDRTFWYSTSYIRQHIEIYMPGYVQRDKITAAALMIGLPVKLDPKDKSKNMIGLRMSKKTIFKYKYINNEDYERFLDDAF